jgi:hypothetical protein
VEAGGRRQEAGGRRQEAGAMAIMRIILSHSSADMDVAERVANALRDAGADVWFDEQNLGATQLLGEIQLQLGASAYMRHQECTV